MKTVFFVVHQGFTTRYLLRTDIFSRFKALGYRIVIISPNSEDEQFMNDYAGENIFFELFDYSNINVIRARFGYRLCMHIRRYLYPGKIDIQTLIDKEYTLAYSAKEKKFKEKFLMLLPLYIAKVIRVLPFLTKVLLQIERNYYAHGFHQKLFDTYKPSLLLLADLGTIDISNFIMYEARKNNVPIVSIILSWDNLTAKGIGNMRPDHAVAWNENMCDELERYHSVPRSRIIKGGVPHFDVYFRDPYPVNKKYFTMKYSVPEGAKVVYFGTASPSIFKENIRLLECLISGVRDQKITAPTVIIVRPHPAYYVRNTDAMVKEYTTIEKIVCENSDIVRLSVPKLLSRTVGVDMPIEDVVLLGSIIKYSDVMVTQYSTLMLEAAIFDTPIINVGFDKIKNTDMRSYELRKRTHLKRVIDVGFTREARSEDELYAAINEYCNDPSLERKERAIIRDAEGGYNKGEAGNAIADALDAIIQYQNKTDVRKRILANKYDTTKRLYSYFNQINEVRQADPETVLEIGVGSNFVSQYLRRMTKVTTIDIEPTYGPDVVASVLDLPLPNDSFDVVLCCQVLEHLPYDQFELILQEFRRIAKNRVIISLPDKRYFVPIQLPYIGRKKIYNPVRKKVNHTFDGQHHWELNSIETSEDDVKNKIKRSGFKILYDYQVFENYKHHFFVLEKMQEQGVLQ